MNDPRNVDVWSDAPPLERSFFARPAPIVARELLGKTIIRNLSGIVLAARIVETEAYSGDGDLASHSYRGQTTRNSSMFGEAGRAYIYKSYGIHDMLNVVTTMQDGPASAVLIRGMEPLTGIDSMQARRANTGQRALLRGPGNVTRALAIDATFDGHDLAIPPLMIVHAPSPSEPIVTTTRIGITKSAELPWRFYLLGSPGVSRPDRATERRLVESTASLRPG